MNLICLHLQQGNKATNQQTNREHSFSFIIIIAVV